MNLYEITFTRVYEGFEKQPHISKEKLWQIPSDSEWNAIARLGLIHTDEDYKLNILKVMRVK